MNLMIRQNAGHGVRSPQRIVAPLALVLLAMAPALMSPVASAVGGLSLALVAALALVGVMASGPGRAALGGLSGWTVPATGFGLGALALILGLTPFAPGGVHPLWAPVGAGAAALDRQTGLEGLVALLGLGLLFVIAAALGTRAERARQAALVLQGATLAAALAYGALSLFKPHTEIGPTALYAGLSLILSVAVLVQAWKAERPRRWIGRVTAAPVSTAIAVVSAALLAISGGIGATASAGFALVLVAGWEALAKRGEGKLRREPMLITLGLMAVAAGAVFLSLLALAAPPVGSDAATAGAVHWRAVLASPWLGYGPGSLEAVARLSMDRLNFTALLAHPQPTSGYVAALEQGGLLATLPVTVALMGVTWLLIDASVRRRRLTTLYRAAVSALGFAAFLAGISTVPVSVAGAAPLVLLLGCSFGAARSGR